MSDVADLLKPKHLLAPKVVPTHGSLLIMQDDAPLPGEEIPRNGAENEDSRVHTDAEDSEDEVMQESREGDEVEDGEDLLDNMEG